MKRWIPFILIVVGCGCVGQEAFTVTDITFCDSEPFDRTYSKNPDASYISGDIVWIYLEAFRFGYTEEMKGEDLIYLASFESTLELYYEDTYITGGSQPIEIASADVPTYAWFKFWIDTALLEEGVYTVSLVITDTASGESAKTEGTFTVEHQGM
jgi:hypothetical protein